MSDRYSCGDARVRAQAYQLGPQERAQYALEGSIAIAGAGVSWLKDSLQVITSPEDSEALARTVDSTGGTSSHIEPRAGCFER